MNLVVSKYYGSEVAKFLKKQPESYYNGTEFTLFRCLETAFIELSKHEDLSKSIKWSETIEKNHEPLGYEVVAVCIQKSVYNFQPILKNQKSVLKPFLSKFRDTLDWYSVSSSKDISFDLDTLIDFEYYLVFNYYKVVNGEYDKTYTSGNDCYNLKGQSYRVSPFQRSLSSSSSVQWSIELIEVFSNNWDWSNLSSNASIPFTAELITHFADKWNWRRLSQNRGVKWDKALVELFESTVNMDGLAINPSVDWESVLPFLKKSAKFSNRIPWDVIATNSGLTREVVEKGYPFVRRGEYDNRIGLFRQTNPQQKEPKLAAQYESARDFYREEAPGFTLWTKPSLSSNPGLEWTDDLLSRNLLKLDFWMIALKGKISSALVIKYAAFFDEVRYVYSTYTKHSDWGTYQVYHFHTGWHNLAFNPNFTIDQPLLEWAKSRTVRTISSYDPYDSATDHDPGSVVLLETEKGEWVSIYNILTATYKPFKLDYSFL